MSIHRFAFAHDGTLAHYIDDELRATVPSAAVHEYRKQQQDAYGVVVPTPAHDDSANLATTDASGYVAAHESDKKARR